MRIARIAACAVALFCLALAPAYAQKGKGGGAPAPHGNPHTTTAAKGPMTTTQSPSAATHGPKSTTHGGPKTTTTTKTHGNPHTVTKASSTSTTNAQSTTTRLNPIGQKLQGKPLGARIEKMLPANMTLNTASAGFRNQGQFIAAVHASQNLGIPFADLKTKMLAGDSLGSAIQALKPEADGQIEARRARARADELTRG